MNSPKAKRPSYLPKKKQSNNKGRFHGSAKWKKKSLAVRSEGVLCKVCWHEGIATPATQTDHIIRLADGGAPFDDRNLMPICDHHHSGKNKLENSGWKPRTMYTINGYIPDDFDSVLHDVAMEGQATGTRKGMGGPNLWL